MIRNWIFISVMALFPSLCKAAVQLEPATFVKEGGFFLLRYSPAQEVAPGNAGARFSVEFLGTKYPLKFLEPKLAVVLVPVPVDTPAGKKEIKVLENAALLETANIEVQKSEFPSEVLRVPPRKVEPHKKDLPKINADLKLLKKIYHSSVSEFLLSSPIVMPVDSIITSIFGSRRLYNGIRASSHLGTDLRAKIGDPIRAPMQGKVVLARSLFFTGNTVILDHGNDFFTIYGHMSKLEVKEGTVIEQGKQLGLAGMTGRASGPHLHWGAQLHGVKIDPMALKDLKWAVPVKNAAGGGN